MLGMFCRVAAFSIALVAGTEASTREIASSQQVACGTRVFLGTMTKCDGVRVPATVTIVTTWSQNTGYLSDVTITDACGRTLTFPNVDTDRMRDGGSQRYYGPGFSGYDSNRILDEEHKGAFEFEDQCGVSKFTGTRS